MTPDLQFRLEKSLAPFNGGCVHNLGELTLRQLRELLGFVCEALKEHYPAVQTFRDWHEHDGYIVELQPQSWSVIENAIANDGVLFDSRDEDYAVRIALCPPNFDWLLRYHIDQNDEANYNSCTCNFDLSVATNAKTPVILDSLLTQFPNLLTECQSQSWFKSNYGG